MKFRIITEAYFWNSLGTISSPRALLHVPSYLSLWRVNSNWTFKYTVVSQRLLPSATSPTAVTNVQPVEYSTGVSAWGTSERKRTCNTGQTTAHLSNTLPQKQYFLSYCVHDYSGMNLNDRANIAEKTVPSNYWGVTLNYRSTTSLRSHCRTKVKKVKCTLVQALRLCTCRTAHRGSRGIALPFHDHGTRRGWGVSVRPRPLFTPGKEPVPIVQEAGWAPGPVWTGAENLAPTGIRSPDRPARSQSLYRLS